MMSGELDHVVTQYLYDNGPNVTTTGSWANSPGTPFKMEFVVEFREATVPLRHVPAKDADGLPR